MVWWYGDMVKVTFTLDDETVATLRKLAERQHKTQSLVVREAVSHYAAKEDTLSDEERDHLLAVVRELGPRLAPRSRADTDRELAGIRASRQRRGRLRPVD